MIELIKNEFTVAQQVLQDFINNPQNLENIQAAAKLMGGALKQGKKIISCGNGGSHCDAMHFAEELSGKFRAERPAIAAMAISDASHISCVGNDYGFDKIFSRAVEALGQEHDVLLAISTSGNSKNVMEACKAAKRKGMRVVGLTGKDGGQLSALCDVEIRVAYFDYADRIQEIHIKVIHTLIFLIEKQLGYAS